MAKSRYDNRSRTAPQRATHNNGKKTEKWEVMRGWVLGQEDDDGDISSWSKMRREAEEKAKERRSRRPNDFDPYLYGVGSHCQDIEDFRDFREQSLGLKPKPKPKKDLNNDGKFSQRTVQTDLTNPSDKGKLLDKQGADPDRPEYDDSSHTGISPAGDVNLDNNKKQPRCQSAESVVEKQHLSNRKLAPLSSAARAKRLISISKTNHDKVTADQIRSLSCGDESGAADATDAPNEAPNDTDKLILGGGSTSAPDPEITLAPPPPAVKLSYTQSHITLRNPYKCLENIKPGPDKNKSNGSTSTMSSNSTTPENTEGEDLSNASSGFMVTSLNDLKEKVGSRSDSSIANQSVPSGTGDRLHSHSQSSLKPELSVTFKDSSSSGLSIATLKSLPKQTESGGHEAENAKTVMTQKQVSLVLRSVTMPESLANGFDGPEASEQLLNKMPISVPTSGIRHHNQHEHLHQATPSEQNKTLPSVVPLSDLLPAVESKLNTRINILKKPRIAGSPTEETNPSDELNLSPEENLIMTRDGIDLMKLKDRHQTILGPPAFRPQSNKTPLQRAKENTSKRLFGPNGGVNNTSYSDINTIRWSSSSGSLYSGNNGLKRANTVCSPDADTRSAPPTARLLKQKKSTAATSHSIESSEPSGKFGMRMMELIRRKTVGTDFRYAVPD